MSFNKWLNDLPAYQLVAIRVTFACVAAILITEAIGLQRNYWSVLAIISINISVHAREVLFRSRAIVINTILGCFSGTFAYYLLNLYLPFYAIVIIILVLALQTLYFSVINYAVGVFFSSVFTVMFIGTLSFWDLSLLWARIFDIAIGALVVLGVSVLLKQRHLKKSFFIELDAVYLNHKHIIEIFVTKNTQDTANAEDEWEKETLRLLVDELILQEKKLVESFINTKIELSHEHIRIIKLLLSTMRELMAVYKAYLILGESKNDLMLKRFCQQKLNMFFEIFKNQYLLVQKLM
ncbi:FUSC family protein [Caedibacter taeniospiralis]|uniref:FUSC family protein n=1 Tax=Caedibacter taeniospiralis TaxID=28907 RepID=UPI0037C0E5F3